MNSQEPVSCVFAVSAKDLPIHLFEDTDFAVALTAVWVGEVRLIDNIILKQHLTQEDNDEL